MALQLKPKLLINFSLLISIFANTGFTIDYEEAQEKLSSIAQTHLLKNWENQTLSEQEELLSQINNLDTKVYFNQKNLLNLSLPPIQEPVTPFANVAPAGNPENILRGKQLIKEGKVGCVIVAGGQGSRLRSDQPKGLHPITIVKQKSLFQFFAEKILALSKQVGTALKLAIMTSPGNHDATIAYFEENNYFELDKEKVSFFIQPELPFLDCNGNLFLESQHKIAQGPNGNGCVLKNFYDSGIWSEWNQKGVRHLFFMFIDNPLVDPFDAELIGFQDLQKSDVAMKCIERLQPEEKLGVVVEKEGKTFIVEYSELFPELMIINEDGKLKYPCGHIGIYSFDMNFVERVAIFYDEIPFHKAWKAVKFLNTNGLTEMSTQPMAWKYEKLIFDILPYAKVVNAILAPRERCFSPLKNQKGSNDLQEVQQALQANDRRIFEEISGTIPPDKPFELSPQFYYPTPEMLEFWKGKELPESSYIEPLG